MEFNLECYLKGKGLDYSQRVKTANFINKFFEHNQLKKEVLSLFGNQQGLFYNTAQIITLFDNRYAYWEVTEVLEELRDIDRKLRNINNNSHLWGLEEPPNSFKDFLNG